MSLLQMRAPSTVLVPNRRAFSMDFLLPATGSASATSVRGSMPIVQVGRSAAESMPALTSVSGPIANTVSGVIYVAVAGAWALFSYSLFTGKWLFQSTHPVWGTITGLIALSSLLGAASSIQAENP